MAITAETLLDAIRAEFTKILEGPGVRWNKQGMILALEQAIAKALAQFVDTY